MSRFCLLVIARIPYAGFMIWFFGLGSVWDLTLVYRLCTVEHEGVVDNSSILPHELTLLSWGGDTRSKNLLAFLSSSIYIMPPTSLCLIPRASTSGVVKMTVRTDAANRRHSSYETHC